MGGGGGVITKLDYFKGFQGGASFVDHLWYLCLVFVMCLSCFRVCSLLLCGHMQGNGLPLVCDVYKVFVTFSFSIPFSILGHSAAAMWQ